MVAPSAEFQIPEKRNKSKRKNRQTYFVLKLVLGWVLFLSAIIFITLQLWPDDLENRPPPVVDSEGPTRPTPEDLKLLERGANFCNSTFLAIIQSATPEQQNQYVANPIATASRMAKFYRMNSMPRVDAKSLTLTNYAVLHLPSKPAIEAHWATQDGQAFDAVFVEENNEWRLDWDHYVRYSDVPWTLFLAGSDRDRGEFRLLARERLAEERKDSDTLSIIFYAPKFGFPNTPGYQSPEFLIKRDSPEGRLLTAAFQQEKSDKRPFNTNLPSINPEGMIRVRATMRRIEENGERRFEMEKLHACHWYSTDAPGIEIKPQSVAK